MEELLGGLLQFLVEFVFEILGEIVGEIIGSIDEIPDKFAEKINLPVRFFNSDEIITLDILYQNKEDFNR